MWMWIAHLSLYFHPIGCVRIPSRGTGACRGRAQRTRVTTARAARASPRQGAGAGHRAGAGAGAGVAARTGECGPGRSSSYKGVSRCGHMGEILHCLQRIKLDISDLRTKVDQLSDQQKRSDKKSDAETKEKEDILKSLNSKIETVKQIVEPMSKSYIQNR